MFDNVNTQKKITSPLFRDVLHAVDNADGLTPKVRINIRSAVIKAAELVSAQGIHGPVDIQKLQKKLEKQTPAMLGMKTNGTLAAFKSNLRRGLRLSGYDILPGRHVTPLSPAWKKLLDQFGENRTRIKLSRFAHVATEQGWEPNDITLTHIERFRALLTTTNLGSKTSKIVRNTLSAWSFGREHYSAWPNVDLGHAPAETRFYSRPWANFPVSFRDDIELYLSRPGTDLESILQIGSESDFLPPAPRPGSRYGGVLRERTKRNYRELLLRAASILVISEQRKSEEITDLAAMIGVVEIVTILRYLSERNQRKEGGQLFQVAFLLYLIARDHVRAPAELLGQLEALWRRVRGPYGEMSPRSFERLCQFDDEEKTFLMAQLPYTLMKKAGRYESPSNPSAIRLARTALFLAIALETGMRSGNIVTLELDRHISFRPQRSGQVAIVKIPAHEVKNNKELISELPLGVTKLLGLWMDQYRLHANSAASPANRYLFPNQHGGHMSVQLATESVKDLGARHAGLDITPHLIRAYIGKLVLDEHPDGHAIVQSILGHNSIETTLKFYAPVRPLKTKRHLQKLLLSKRQKRGSEDVF